MGVCVRNRPVTEAASGTDANVVNDGQVPGGDGGYPLNEGTLEDADGMQGLGGRRGGNQKTRHHAVEEILIVTGDIDPVMRRGHLGPASIISGGAG